MINVQHMTTVTGAFFQGRFAHSGNISAVTDQILTKLFVPSFLGLNVFVWMTIVISLKSIVYLSC